MALFSDHTPRVVAPGAVHLPGWLSIDGQADLVRRCRGWSLPPAGMRHIAMPRGGVMSVRQVSLGWHWVPYRYSRYAEDTDGAAVKAFPKVLGELAGDIVAAAWGADTAIEYHPDVALINFYPPGARMGMHQDSDEACLAPVVSMSLGDSCVFRFGNTRNRQRPYTDVTLESGDAFVFGHASRMAYHGVPKTFPDTGPDGVGLSRGRLNITIRQSGFG